MCSNSGIMLRWGKAGQDQSGPLLNGGILEQGHCHSVQTHSCQGQEQRAAAQRLPMPSTGPCTSEPTGKLLALPSPGCKQRGSPWSPSTLLQDAGNSRALGLSPRGCALAVVPPPAGPGQGCGCPEGGCTPPWAPRGPGGAAQGRVAPGLSSHGSSWHGRCSQPRPRG